MDVDSENGGRQCFNEEGKPFKNSDDLDIQKIVCKVDVDTPMCPEKVRQPYWSSWGEWGYCDGASLISYL